MLLQLIVSESASGPLGQTPILSPLLSTATVLHIIILKSTKTHKGQQLSDSGRRYPIHARNMIDPTDSKHRDIEDLEGGKTGHLDLGH
jgi:hypothetical protein